MHELWSSCFLSGWVNSSPWIVPCCRVILLQIVVGSYHKGTSLHDSATWHRMTSPCSKRPLPSSYPPPFPLDKPFGFLQKRINVAKGNFISYSFCQTNVRRFASPFLQERWVAEKNINTLQFNLLSFHLDQRETIKFYGLNAIHRSPRYFRVLLRREERTKIFRCMLGSEVLINLAFGVRSEEQLVGSSFRFNMSSLSEKLLR